MYYGRGQIKLILYLNHQKTYDNEKIRESESESKSESEWKRVRVRVREKKSVKERERKRVKERKRDLSSENGQILGLDHHN